MRVVTLFALVLALAAGAVADDKAARERRVKVALALSAPAPSPPAGEVQCCREDAAAAWEDALKEKRPIVLFVGGPCDGLGMVAATAGAVAVKVPSYAQPGHAAAEKRIVVGRPKVDGSGFDLTDTLAPAAQPAAVAAAVKAAQPKKAAPPSPPKIDWFIN
jgi:hypothetical protein